MYDILSFIDIFDIFAKNKYYNNSYVKKNYDK